LRKIKTLFAFVIVLAFGKLEAENISVEVINLASESAYSWTIANEAGHTEYASSDFLDTDTFLMELEADQRFHFRLSIDDVSPKDSSIAVLQVNSAPIMLINGDVGLGEFSYSFVTGTKEPVLKIVGGSDTSIEDFPWQIYFSSGNYMCGGTIISKRWIMTAAHCTQDGDNLPIASDQMRVKVGATNPYGSAGKWYDVKSYTIHESYSNTQYTNDIAVLELYEDIDFDDAETIELISSDEVTDGYADPGVMSTVTGWGLTRASDESTSADYPNTLQMVQLPIVSNETAAKVWGSRPSSMLMAGYEAGNKDACSGDSGGPLVVSVDGTYKIAGIVSWGSEECNTYGAFTRVSSFLDWIEENTGVTPGGSLTKPQGDFEVCQGTITSEYYTSAATADTYEWILTPDSAGSIYFLDDSAIITWNTDYLGFAELQVRADIDGEQSPWSTSTIELQKNTALYSSPGDTTVCEGDFVKFSVVADGHDLVYNWFKDGDFYKSTTTGDLSILFTDTLDSGEYYCVVEGSCQEISTSTFHLTVLPNTLIQSISADTTAIQNDDVRLRVVSQGHNRSYQWYKDDAMMVGSTMPYLDLLAVDANDIAKYNVEIEGTCSSDTSDYIYVYVDAKTSDDVQARVWPSIVSNVLNTAISNNKEYQVEVYDLNGHIIYSQEGATNQNVIDASAWQSGVYIVQITSQYLIEPFNILKQ